MKKYFFQNGQTLMEILLALAVLLVVLSGGMVLSVRYLETLGRSLDIREISGITQETFEAVENIGAGEWSILQNSDSNISYGLVKSQNMWQLESNPDLIKNRFTRSIRILPVYRDGSCQITSTPGSLDPDTKEVELTLSWNIGDKHLTRSFEKYFTNWRNPTPLCDTDTPAPDTEAWDLEIYVDASVLNTTHKQITGIEFRNNGIDPITIDRMIIEWKEESNGEIRIITIDGANRWHSSASGNWGPSGEQPTGTELDIDNVTIQPGQNMPVDKLRFNEMLDGSIFTITAIMGDSSRRVVSKDFTP